MKSSSTHPGSTYRNGGHRTKLLLGRGGLSHQIVHVHRKKEGLIPHIYYSDKYVFSTNNHALK